MMKVMTTTKMKMTTTMITIASISLMKIIFINIFRLAFRFVDSRSDIITKTSIPGGQYQAQKQPDTRPKFVLEFND